MGKDKTAKLNLIRKRLIDEFDKQILSAVVYGSTLGVDFCKYSDYDILLIFEKIEFDTFKRLRRVKEQLSNDGIPVDFNTHTYSELPSERKEVFWHNNRSLYMQKELALYGKVLFGEDYFKDIELNHKEMLAEAVKVISSLNYQIRKMLVNKELNLENRVTAMKWCIYSVMYFLAANDIYPKDKQEALKIFVANFNPKINPVVFLDSKINHPEKITDEELEKAYNFLANMEDMIYAFYKRTTND